MDIAIVGLGLIGGSVAMAAKGFRFEGEVSRRTGIDIDEKVLSAALETGAAERAVIAGDDGEAIRAADLIVLCLYPRASFEYLRERSPLIKSGAVVTDVCGVKADFVERSAALIPQASYVGGHPMAGRELSGFDAALPTLFSGCNYIITPSGGASERAIGLTLAFARHLGAGRISFADPDTHDRKIAYTSQLAHVLAAAVVRNPILKDCAGFAGGSLEDITRVARLNSRMWSELFIANRGPLSSAVAQLERDLANIRRMIEDEDYSALGEELARSTQCKERWADSML